MGLLLTAGLPLAIFYILFTHRHRLKDPKVVESWGFLYETFGTRAYLWEVEELMRKLWLTAIVVLMPTGERCACMMLLFVVCAYIDLPCRCCCFCLHSQASHCKSPLQC